MPESSELFSEIANLRDQVDDMSRTVSAIARKSGFKDDILEAMGQDPLLAQVFLLVDGQRTQNDIVAALRERGQSATQPTISRKLDSLVEDWDLVRKTTRDRLGVRYVQTSLARNLRITRSLEKQTVNAAPGSARLGKPGGTGGQARVG
jgi:hypothetical protein